MNQASAGGFPPRQPQKLPGDDLPDPSRGPFDEVRALRDDIAARVNRSSPSRLLVALSHSRQSRGQRLVRALEQPILAVPARVRMAAVDSDEFAEYIVACLADGQSGEREDFAGPQTLTMIELMEQYLRSRGEQRRIRRAPLPKKLQAALTAGNTSPDARLGETTWAQWLQRSSAARRPDLGLAA